MTLTTITALCLVALGGCATQSPKTPAALTPTTAGASDSKLQPVTKTTEARRGPREVLQLVTTLRQSDLLLTDTLVFDAQLVNSGTQPIVIDKRLPHWLLDIHDARGQRVSGHQLIADLPMAAPEDFVTLQPGEQLTRTVQFSLTRWYVEAGTAEVALACDGHEPGTRDGLAAWTEGIISPRFPIKLRDPLVLDASPKKSLWQTGEVITVTATWRNIGAAPVWIDGRLAYRSIVVHDAAEKEVSCPQVAVKLMNPKRSEFVQIPEGGSVTKDYSLDCDLPPGRYSLTLKVESVHPGAEFGLCAWRGSLQSPPMAVTVTE